MPTIALPSSSESTKICLLLSSHRYAIQDEKSLQDGIELVLASKGLDFVRELHLDARNRPDFQIGSVAIEVKTKGSIAEFLRQANRYLLKPEISELILVGTPKWMSRVPSELSGKPVYTVRLMSSLI